MQATPFEFQRFWIFGAFYWIGFSFYSIDHVNAVQWIADRYAAPNSYSTRSRGVAGSRFGRWRSAFTACFAFLRGATDLGNRLYARELMQDSSLTRRKSWPTDRIVHVRNPNYLGGSSLALGMGLLMSRARFLFSCLGCDDFFPAADRSGGIKSDAERERGASSRNIAAGAAPDSFRLSGARGPGAEFARAGGRRSGASFLCGGFSWRSRRLQLRKNSEIVLRNHRCIAVTYII